MFNNYSIIWIIRIFLQIRIRIRIFLPESRIFGFGFENFLTTNKIRIRIRKFSGLRIRFEIRIRSKKRFVSTLIYISISSYVSRYLECDQWVVVTSVPSSRPGPGSLSSSSYCNPVTTAVPARPPHHPHHVTRYMCHNVTVVTRHVTWSQAGCWSPPRDWTLSPPAL